MAFDPNFTLGNGITVGVLLAGFAGSWMTLKLGLRSTNSSLTEFKRNTGESLAELKKSTARDLNEIKASLKEHADKVEGQITDIKQTYVSEKADEQKEKLTTYRMSQLEESIKELKRSAPREKGA